MVKSVCIYRNNEYIFIALEEYLKQYHSQIPNGWVDLKKWIDRVFEKNADYGNLSNEIQVEHFDIKAIKEAYLNLRTMNYNLDDDILKFMAFLFGTSYFIKIGNPAIDLWLNATDLNHPLKNGDKGDFSCMDAIEFRYGQNAIRKKLLSTLRWISSQGGS
ncbi:hypothetical protein [Alistipes sp. ZOR0009]|uniref:hypothetical protein n=1 Tax=Alistipes sp. ZOR0009 TaxID=1339253 RepID=UPI000646FDC0|nr:hypothetical protein [Alistipes sp. ZOR0009]